MLQRHVNISTAFAPHIVEFTISIPLFHFSVGCDLVMTLVIFFVVVVLLNSLKPLLGDHAFSDPLYGS